jgi:hypothetical protein
VFHYHRKHLNGGGEKDDIAIQQVLLSIKHVQLLTQKLTQAKMAISSSGFENNGHHSSLSSGVEANYKKRKKCFCFRKYNHLNSESQKRIMNSVVLYTDQEPHIVYLQVIE